MEIEDNILSIADKYDTFFIDVYGVLFDGITLYDRAAYTLAKLKRLGKKIIILSNTTQTSVEAKIGHSKRGIVEGLHYDEFITSGEFLNYTITKHREKFESLLGFSSKTVKCLFMGNSKVFENSHLTKVDSLEDADFLYVGIPKASYGAVRVDNVFNERDEKINIEDVSSQNWYNLKDRNGLKGFAEFAHHLQVCLKNNKVLLVANPDIFAVGTLDDSNIRVPIVTQGCIGAYYEKIGGKVIYFGKPQVDIFEYTKQFTDTQSRIAMIGDTPWTDIAGANLSNIDSVIVMTGVFGEFLKNLGDDIPFNKKLDIIFNQITPKMTKFVSSVNVNHIIKHFSSID